MQIKIQTELYVPLEIGELKFQLDFSDKGIEKIIENFQKVADKVELKGNTLKDVAEAMKETVDFILGEGSYDKIYEKYPSIIAIKEVVEELTKVVILELEKRVPVKDEHSYASYLKKNNK